MIEEGPSKTNDDFWMMYVDGSSNSTGSGAKEIVAEYALHFEFPATNNEAKYEASTAGLQIARELRI